MSGLNVTATPVIVDLGWNEIMKNLGEFKESHVDVGLYGEGDSPRDNIAARGAVHEYGSMARVDQPPARPFMRQTFEKNKDSLQDFVLKGAQAIEDKTLTTKDFFKRLGVWYEGLMKRIFVEGEFKALAPATIARKGSDAPLIDTGTMRGSITHRIWTIKKESAT